MTGGLDLRNTGQLHKFYRQQLLQDCVPFWLQHSLDRSCGGYLTMLDRDGTVYGTGKYVWPQAREAYMFAKLYNTVEKNPDWLAASRLGVEFLARHALDQQNRACCKLTREGVPLYSRPWEIFAESFIVLAFAEFARAAGSEQYLQRAKEIFWTCVKRLESGELDRQPHVHEVWYREHAPTMILMNTAQELRGIEEDPRYTPKVAEWVHLELHEFSSDEHRVMFERIGLGGRPALSEPEGRSITPGHCLESCAFCLREGQHLNDPAIIARACSVIDWTMKLGWDERYGGLYNFVDLLGKPPGHQDEDWGESQDWDAKLFWVHSEALYALLLAWHLSGDERFFRHYEKVHHWSFEHFPDPVHGEWFGYLRRDGSVSQTLKGCVKGFFHIPRAFLNCMLLLERVRAVESDGGKR